MPTKTKPKPKAKTKAKPKVSAAKTSVRVSLHTDLPSGTGPELPRGSVKLDKTAGLKINVERLSRSLLRDQRARLVSSMGCISNPGGPGC